MNAFIFVFYLSASIITDARNFADLLDSQEPITHPWLHPLNADSYGLSSPFSLPPFESLSPHPLPENTPPPPYAPNFHFQSPPSRPSAGPTMSPGPNPPDYIINPPITIPNPPEYIPSPPKRTPNPPIYKPPVVYPAPILPPPPSHEVHQFAVWCVAKPSVPDPIIQEAMDYACGSGADCNSIQPNGQCFQPNTLLSHASYAFNSYWQSRKVTGGTCDFGGTAMLVAIDPSSYGCQYIYT